MLDANSGKLKIALIIFGWLWSKKRIKRSNSNLIQLSKNCTEKQLIVNLNNMT